MLLRFIQAGRSLPPHFSRPEKGNYFNFLIPVVLFAFSFLAVPFSRADTFIVTDTDDLPGASCDSSQPHSCTSLRAAVEAANNGPSGTHSLTIPQGIYSLLLGQLSLTNPDNIITINGAGRDTTIIDGGGLDRVFYIGSVATATMNDLTIRNGIKQGDYGGGIYVSISGKLTLNQVTLTGNQGDRGGGVYIFIGTTDLRNVDLLNNASSLTGILDGGGGIYNDGGSLTFLTGLVSSNQGQSGGGLYNAGGATIRNVYFENNSADTNGGAIYNDGALIVEKTTLAGSQARKGGGIYNTGVIETVINATLSGNSAIENGGGIYNSSGGTAALTNVTLSINSAASNGGGGIYNLNNTINGFTLKNTLMANSSGGNCAGSGTVTSSGHNLEDENACGLSMLLGDLINTDPNLGPLQDNEGPTLTQALIPPSPAINAGDNNGCPDTDQRGVRRPLSLTCDIGAFEYNPFIHSLFLPLVTRN